MRLYLLALVLLMPCSFIAQLRDNDTTWNQLEVQTKGKKMGVFNTETEEYLIPFGNYFIHKSEYTHAIAKVSKNDAITLYFYQNKELSTIYNGTEDVLLEIPMKPYYEGQDDNYPYFCLNDSCYSLDTPNVWYENELNTYAEFGVTVNDTYITVTDRKLRGMPGYYPLIDEDPESPNFGENLIVTDPVTGQQSFVYSAPDPALYASGVYAREERRWLVPTVYDEIFRTTKGWTVSAYQENDSLLEYGRLHEVNYLLLDENGRVNDQGFTQNELYANHQLYRHFVPKYSCDSLAMLPDEEFYVYESFEAGNTLFYSKGKTGSFDLFYTKVVIPPSDFLIQVPAIGRSIGLRLDTLFVTDPDTSYDIRWNDFQSLSLGVVYDRNFETDAFGAIRVEKTTGIDSIFYVQEAKGMPRSSVNGWPQLNYSFENIDAFDAYVVMDRIEGSSLLMVNYVQSSLRDNLPLIDEDPNSPYFGEYLTVENDFGDPSFVYPTIFELRYKSGVLDVSTGKWIVAPIFYRVEHMENGFISHTGDSNWGIDEQITYDLEGNVISVQTVGEDFFQKD